MPAGAESARAAGRPMRPRPDEVLRFRASERQLHWAVAVPFMVSYVTALILVVVYNPRPDRPLRELVSLVHKISGISLIVLPLVTILRHRRDLGAHLENIRRAWSWSWSDVRWLLLMGPSAVSPRIELPHQGKFNAAEKINFMVLLSTYPLYVVTGLLIWLPGVAILAWFLHFGMAIVATPLMLGHIFMATINRDTRAGLSGMVTGFVDRQWAKHHYRLWYDELHGGRDGVRMPGRTERPSGSRPAPAPQQVLAGRQAPDTAEPRPTPLPQPAGRTITPAVAALARRAADVRRAPAGACVAPNAVPLSRATPAPAPTRPKAAAGTAPLYRTAPRGLTETEAG